MMKEYCVCVIGLGLTLALGQVLAANHLGIASIAHLAGGRFRTRQQQNQNLGGKRAIVNGNPVSRDWRFFVKVTVGANQFCGGAIVAPKWVVTAAHCIREKQNAVLAGNYTSGGHEKTRYTVRRTIIHDDYRPELWNEDIALVELESEVSNGYNQVIQICEQLDLSNQEFKLVGMGAVSHRDVNEVAFDLQEVPYKEETDLALCIQNGLNLDNLTKQVCAVGEHIGDDWEYGVSCNGDSGGPLFTEEENGEAECLYGIVSYGTSGWMGEDPVIKINCFNGFTAFTRVRAYYPWISKYISKEE